MSWNRLSSLRDANKHQGISFVRLAVATCGLLTAAPAQAADEDGGCVGKPSNMRAYVTVENVRSGSGEMTITLYPDVAGRFLRRKGSLYVRRVPAQTPRTRICFLIPAAGIYAIGIYHDENGNGRIDRTGIGLPSEGYGFSNNASTMFGLPSFSAVRIRLNAGSETRITLRYLRGDEWKRARNRPGVQPPAGYPMP